MSSGRNTRPEKASNLIFWAQFPLLEEALSALGIVVWPMVEFEADDALAAAAFAAEKDPVVDRVFICTPDKNLSQCVRGIESSELDRRKNIIRDEAGVIAKFGVEPVSIPDYLALVGDAADGYPSIASWTWPGEEGKGSAGRDIFRN